MKEEVYEENNDEEQYLRKAANTIPQQYIPYAPSNDSSPHLSSQSSQKFNTPFSTPDINTQRRFLNHSSQIT